MKVLILTQKVDINDDVLGFFHGWIQKFSEKFDKVNVICLKKGKYNFSDNVCVWSLGKEEGESKFKYIYRFYKYIWNLRKDYDVVFVHMNPEYVVLGGLFWRIWGKKIAMWYAHLKGSNLRRIALWFSHRVFSVSEASFVNHKSKKFRPMGHGIDTDLFHCNNKKDEEDNIKKIVTIGRLSPVKKCEVLIKAVRRLRHELGEENFIVQFIGSKGSDKDDEYFKSLLKMVKDFDIEKQIEFLGSVSNNGILPYLCEADIFVSMQQIGGAGKSTLEAMSSGLLAVVCTPVFNFHFGDALDYLYYDGSEEDLALKLKKCIHLNQDKTLEWSTMLREIVKKHHNLENLVSKIVKEYELLDKIN